MTFNTLVGTVSSTSSQAVNLLNYAMSFDSFRNSEYIIFNDSEYSYYIVWGDLYEQNGKVVSNGDVEYIRYYRTSASGYNSVYTYGYGSDRNFSLSLSQEYICTTSVANVGFVSSAYQECGFYQSAIMLMVFVVAMVFAIMIKNFRGGAKQ